MEKELTTKTTKQIAFVIVLFTTLFVMFSKGAFISSYSSASTMAPAKIKPVTKTETVKFIYRGIALGNPGYEAALSGKAYPVGGHSSPTMHRDGMTDSQFTSWTTDFMIAYKFATNGLYGQCTGVILVKKVDVSGARFVDSNTLKGGDIYKEKEILVKGMIDGAIPILVNPKMSKESIFKLLHK